jgi:hypothetical protein
MKTILILGNVLLWAGVAHAQDKAFNLSVSMQDLQAISAGLDELPRKISEPIVQKFQKQLLPQMQPKADAEKSGVTPEVDGTSPVHGN